MFSQHPRRPINSPPPAPLHLWFYIISILIRRPLWSHCRFVVFAESISNENPHKYVCRESGSSENPKTFSFSGDLEFLSVWPRISATRAMRLTTGVWPPYFGDFAKCQLVSSALVYQFLCLIFPPSGLSHGDNLNQFCLSNPDTPRAKPQSPCSRRPTALTACITARWC